MTMFTIILNHVVKNLGKETLKYFADNTIKCIFIVFRSNLWHVMKISWKFVSNGPIDDKSSFVQAVAWSRIGSKLLPEQMMTYFTNISVSPVPSFTKEVNPRLTKCPLKTNGRLANRGLTSLVKEATGIKWVKRTPHIRPSTIRGS